MSKCACEWESEDYGAGVSQMICTEPDVYCAECFPINHQIRDDTAAAGYTMKRTDMLHACPWSRVDEWENLPEPGKDVWRRWAEAEQWGAFMVGEAYEDGSAGNALPTEPQPDPFPQPSFPDGANPW
jgi:hypothetical protein